AVRRVVRARLVGRRPGVPGPSGAARESGPLRRWQPGLACARAALLPARARRWTLPVDPRAAGRDRALVAPADAGGAHRAGVDRKRPGLLLAGLGQALGVPAAALSAARAPDR